MPFLVDTIVKIKIKKNLPVGFGPVLGNIDKIKPNTNQMMAIVAIGRLKMPV
jgi:hypothetical protein